MEAWGTKAEKQHIFRKRVVFIGLATFGGKANKPRCLLALVPQASKNHLANKTFRDAVEDP